MLRAATLGVLDFAQFDPWDPWWWTRMYAVLEDLARQQNLQAHTATHQHWLAMVSNPRMTEDGWDNARQHSGEALNQILKAVYPWRAKEIGDAGTRSSREHAADTFHEVYGKPGEARYEQHVAELGAYLAKGKLSQRQKEQERKQRQTRWQQRQSTLAS